MILVGITDVKDALVRVEEVFSLVERVNVLLHHTISLQRLAERTE